MIEKSRLEELIKEGATIYTISKEIFVVGVSELVKVTPYKLNESFYIAEADREESLMIRLFDENSNIQPALIGYLQNLFETEKQAEWALQYQLIPRTEWLNLPMWEEFKNQDKPIRFCGEDWEVYELRLALDKSEIYLDEVGDYEMYEQDRWEATEENYTTACDLCVKLFKGESDGKD